MKTSKIEKLINIVLCMLSIIIAIVSMNIFLYVGDIAKGLIQ